MQTILILKGRLIIHMRRHRYVNDLLLLIYKTLPKAYVISYYKNGFKNF